MKIDLHCHTLNCKKGDGENREPTVELFAEKIELSEVKVVAITNHNHFNKQQYDLFRNTVKENCDVWPGIELDVKELGSKAGHVLIITSPELVDQFYDVVNKNINIYNPNTLEITVGEMCRLFNPLNVVYIPHYFKDHQLEEVDLELLESKAYPSSRILHEPSDIKSLGVLNANGFKSVLGSDVKNWNEYEKYKFAEMKYEIQGYDNFLKLLDKNITFINDLITQDFYEEIEVYGIASKKQHPYKIKVYNDVNIIFGDKGSGKTEILESLYQYFKNSKGMNPIKFNGGDKSNWFKNLIKSEKGYTYEDMGVNNVDTVFNDFKNFVDFSPVKIEKYLNYSKNISNNKKRKKLKILDQQKIFTYDLKRFNKLYSDYKKIVTFINELIAFEIYQLNIDKFQSIIEQLKLMAEEAYVLCLDEWINQKKDYFVDNTIDKLITFVSESDGTHEKPTETGFYKFIKNRLIIENDIFDLNNILNTEPKIINEEYIGKIGDKGDGILYSELGFVNKSNIEKIDYKKMYSSKTPIKDFLKYMLKVQELIFSVEMMDYLAQLNEKIENNQINNINMFLYNDKTFKLNNKDYKPSRGEMAILSLQYELISKKTEQVFLIDELEVNLGSTYIENTIVPLIKDLAKSKKIVVIATHDANIATRTYPVNSILKTVDNGFYETYQGSMFTNKLINSDNSKVLNWNTESEKYLEGGKPAFKERGDLYGE